MQTADKDTPREYPVVPLLELVVYPETRTRFPVDPTTGRRLLTAAALDPGSCAVGLTVRGANPPVNSAESLSTTGNLLRVVLVEPTDDGFLVVADVVERVRVLSLTGDDGALVAVCEPFPDVQDLDDDEQARLLREVQAAVREISSRFEGAEKFVQPVDQMDSVDQVLGFVMPFMPIDLDQKQALLETASVRERYEQFLALLVEARDAINLRVEVAQKVSHRVNRANRESMLREQLRVIQEELGLNEGSGDHAGSLERIEASAMPDEVRRRAIAEARRLEVGGSNNHESTVIRNYLDLLLDLPWETGPVPEINTIESRRVLDSHHNGLEKVKERIVQHLAVMRLKGGRQGSILLLSGPPGTGKTSLGKSIAEALGREYVRVSLGGVRDEAEIRGHRRTYVGALPGRIIQGIRRAGTKNPVFVLDEIDKLASSHSGDPASALLEALDPEQNSAFSDHYVEVPYDLSDVFFIATANSLTTIPAPLLDRMELIEVSGYTAREKFAIAKDHLVPEVLEAHGLDADQLCVEDDALRGIIERYTREAGVRQLKRELEKVARHVSERLVSQTAEPPVVVRLLDLATILGREPVRLEMMRRDAVPGVVTGLAWTPVGGDVLFIEATFMPGSGKLTLTGQLGEVMKESATISLSLIRSRLAGTVNGYDFMASDTHIHVPSGATPKDGPSAGVTLCTALASLITGRAVDPELAMTGEVTLSGAVLPVGGIREKVLAAHRAGIRRVVLPRENERDLVDVPADVREVLSFVFVENIEEVLRAALGIELPRSTLLSVNDRLTPAPGLLSTA